MTVNAYIKDSDSSELNSAFGTQFIGCFKYEVAQDLAILERWRRRYSALAALHAPFLFERSKLRGNSRHASLLSGKGKSYARLLWITLLASLIVRAPSGRKPGDYNLCLKFGHIFKSLIYKRNIKSNQNGCIWRGQLQ